ncbi:keratin, type I cytoskeletal 18-like [Astyanax mexicanus]|uniref:Keratin, type I cytoskeletal 18-like n=1 Tax=Astyanax mexicanus TaxID=7994 RepID=A0A8T2M8F1_ASTMX|nr:keratin, type I cytoskeletal 18-like [Astyanax mexicanus]
MESLYIRYGSCLSLVSSMSRNSASSMFGGAGGQGARASVSTLQALRNAMRPESQQQPQGGGALAPPPADDKKTMESLNNRLSGYLGRVRKLEKSNQELEEQIRDILEKRGQTADRDWDKIEKPLADLRKEIRDKTMENARLLLQIDNSKLANEDLKNKLDTESIARQNLEHDLSDLRRVIDDSQLARLDLESQIESGKEELAFLKKEHRDEVAVLKEKIKESSVTVEADSSHSNLSHTVNKIREQYEKLAVKNREETDDWYKNKFENIKVEVAKNTESLQNSRTELTELRRTKQLREIDVQALQSMIVSLEETLRDSEGRYGKELARLNRILQQLGAELTKVRDQVERQAQEYQALLNVKMKLEAEIDSYRCLLGATDDSANFSLEQAIQNEGELEEFVSIN